MNKVKILIILMLLILLSCAGKPKNYTIINHDKNNNLLTIKLGEHLTTGTDAACAEAAKVLHELCSQGYTVEVVGDCPSAVNPMTVEWTKKLMDTRGEPVPFNP